MQNLWNEEEAARFAGDLAQRVYTSRLLGRDSDLVLHGGGNTSVKIRQTNLFGEEEDILYVKGSGWDLETIEEAGFAPASLPYLLRLAALPSLSDLQMANQLRRSLIDPGAPSPSVETILHAVLPYRFVDHTHADAIVTVTNTPSGAAHVREIYGDLVVIIPYVMPGFELARYVAEVFPVESSASTVGMILMNHGIFTFGDTARDSYGRMIDLVSRAEDYLMALHAWHISMPDMTPPAGAVRQSIAALRRDVSSAAGFPVVMATHSDRQSLSFARRDDLEEVSQQGPATPDHIIRTKRVPLVGRDVQGFIRAYEHYFSTHAAGADHELAMLDPAPRVILDRELGMYTVGRTAAEAAIAEDIYRHTMDIVWRATMLERYQALPAAQLFAVEYWDLEQAKLRKPGKPPVFTGEVALVTGTASGIGRACVDVLLKRGAAVVGLDVDPAVGGMLQRRDFVGLECDVGEEQAVCDGIERAVRAFGGLDMLVLNAGIFPPGGRVESLDLSIWRRAMQVNVEANVVLLREAHPLLKLAPRGGRVVVVGSRNVPAPGPGAGVYSASKAALNQLARLAALEWGEDNIRVNVVHPDAVYDTALWTEELLRARAAEYGMSVEQYRRRNVLRTEVSSRDVAELVAAMCGPAFARITGAQVPIDGGNERVI